VGRYGQSTSYHIWKQKYETNWNCFKKGRMRTRDRGGEFDRGVLYACVEDSQWNSSVQLTYMLIFKRHTFLPFYRWINYCSNNTEWYQSHNLGGMAFIFHPGTCRLAVIQMIQSGLVTCGSRMWVGSRFALCSFYSSETGGGGTVMGISSS
jgi:hypothetical protein